MNFWMGQIVHSNIVSAINHYKMYHQILINAHNPTSWSETDVRP